eukprot:m.109432 g.109432  ORF g.109432 m.109432 type:complete len:436 (+) comp12732_c0_seq1:6733-8040(+)
MADSSLLLSFNTPTTMSELKTNSHQQRDFDVVVFGASGFTGQYVAEYISKKGGDFKVAIAGRNKNKLDGVNTKFGTNFPILIADVNDQETVDAMAKRARVVLNCVGPYRFFGESVVKACAGFGTHYLDISGEPEFIERMEYDYNEQAKASGAIIVSACGFDSIPADMGTAFCVKTMTEKGVIPSSIQSYLSVDYGEAGMGVHFTTYECAVHGFSSAAELRTLRRKRAAAKVPVVGPKLKRGSALPTWNKSVNAYCIPFPGSDASIVRRSQQHLVETNSDVPPVQYGAWFTIQSTLWTTVFTAFGTVFGMLANFGVGRSLLLKYPGVFTFGLFSHEGPTQAQMEGTSFAMNFHATGFSSQEDVDAKKQPNFNIHCRVSGPEPGYISTPICLVECCKALLENEETIEKGVLTSASAFRNTNLIDNLHAAGVKFEVVE